MSGIPSTLLSVPTRRPAWADIDLDAITHNARVLRRACEPAELCAVVKANGYGHGAVPVARAAVAGGATWLGVALVEEGIALRAAGIDAPVLVLSEPATRAMVDVVTHRLTPAVYTDAGIAAAAAAARGTTEPLAVHLKIDTGMHRVGAAPGDAPRLVAAVAASPQLTLGGVFTHLAVADEPANPYTDAQLGRFAEALGTLGDVPPLVHMANSAAALFHPASRHDLVRCGIALYGLAPAPAHTTDEVVRQLRPAMTLRAEVSHVKRREAGARLSYGLRYELPAPSVVATVPLGYADGVPRRLGAVGGQVLIHGRRRPIAGTVTMDQLLVDCGPDADVIPGDEVLLLGAQGNEAIGAWEWAERLDTISYEIVCGISERVPRRYRGGPDEG